MGTGNANLCVLWDQLWKWTFCLWEESNMKSDSGWVASNPLAVGANDFCSGTGKLGSRAHSLGHRVGLQGWRRDLPSQRALVIHLSPGGMGVSLHLNQPWICRTWLLGEVSNLFHSLSQPGPLSPQLLFLALMGLGCLRGTGLGSRKKHCLTGKFCTEFTLWSLRELVGR